MRKTSSLIFLLVPCLCLAVGESDIKVLNNSFPRRDDCLLEASSELEIIQDTLKPGDLIFSYDRTYPKGIVIRNAFAFEKWLFLKEAPRASNFLFHTAVYMGDGMIGQSGPHSYGDEILTVSLADHLVGKKSGNTYYLVVRNRSEEIRERAVQYLQLIMKYMAKDKLSHNFSYKKALTAVVKKSKRKMSARYVQAGLAFDELRVRGENKLALEGKSAVQYSKYDLNLTSHCTGWIARSFMAAESYLHIDSVNLDIKAKLGSEDYIPEVIEVLEKLNDARTAIFDFNINPQYLTPQSLWVMTQLNKNNSFDNVCVIKSFPYRRKK